MPLTTRAQRQLLADYRRLIQQEKNMNVFVDSIMSPALILRLPRTRECTRWREAWMACVQQIR